MRVRKVSQTGQAEHADQRHTAGISSAADRKFPILENLQKTNSKHQHDLHLLLHGHAQLRQRSHRQHDDRHVQDNLYDRRRPTQSIPVPARKLLLAVPVLPCSADRRTLVDRDDNAEGRVERDCAHHDVDLDSDVLDRENAEVEEEEGSHGEEHGELVDPFAVVVSLS